MSKKTLVIFGMILGSAIGGYVPAFFGVDLFSYTALITSSVGAILGILIGFKLGE